MRRTFLLFTTMAVVLLMASGVALALTGANGERHRAFRLDYRHR